MSTYRRTILISTFSQMVTYGIPLVTFPLLVRAFDLDTYGSWIEANTLIALANVLGTQGLGNTLSALVTGQTDDHDAIYCNALYLFVGIGGVLTVAMTALAPWLNAITMRSRMGVELMQTAAPLILIYGLNWFGLQVYRLRQQPARGAIFDMGLAAARLSVVVFAFFTHDFLAFAQIFVGMQAALTVVQIVLAFRGLRLVAPQPAILRDLVRHGANLSVVSQANWLVMFGDRFLLSVLRTTGEVAVYSVTYQLALTLAALGWPYLYALLPALGERVRAEDEAGMREAVRRSLRWMLIVLIPATVGLTFTGSVLIRLIATPEFTPGTLLIGLIACGILLDTLGNNLQYVFYVQNRSDALRGIFIRMALFNILANLIAMPWFGIMGAGTTTLLTFLLGGVLLVQQVRIPVSELIDVNTLWRCMLLGVMVGGWVVLTLRDDLKSLAFTILGAALLYGIGLLTLGVIPIDKARKLLFRQ